MTLLDPEDPSHLHAELLETASPDVLDGTPQMLLEMMRQDNGAFVRMWDSTCEARGVREDIDIFLAGDSITDAECQRR